MKLTRNPSKKIKNIIEQQMQEKFGNMMEPFKHVTRRLHLW
jgi:hypothetical protein